MFIISRYKKLHWIIYDELLNRDSFSSYFDNDSIDSNYSFYTDNSSFTDELLNEIK